MSGYLTVSDRVVSRAGRMMAGLIVVAAAGGCSSTDVPPSLDELPRPAIAREATPDRLLLPPSWPAGWKPVDRGLEDRSFRSAQHSVFMPPGSTAGRGPAIVVAYAGDDEASPSACDRHRGDVEFPGPEVRRWGSGLAETSGAVPPPPFVTAVGYAFARGVSDETLLRAAVSVEWVDEHTPPRVQLPAGFTLRAAGSLAPMDWSFPAHVRVRRGEEQIEIGEARFDAAGRFLAQFWNSISPGGLCWGGRTAQRTVIDGETVAQIRGRNTPAGRRAIAEIAASLEAVDRSAFCAVAPAFDPDDQGACALVG